jgi:hypothetical protein
MDAEEFDRTPLDEPIPPRHGNDSKAHTKKRAAKVAPFDGHVLGRPNPTTPSPACSRTRSTSCTPGGTTRRPAESAAAAPAGTAW